MMIVVEKQLWRAPFFLWFFLLPLWTIGGTRTVVYWFTGRARRSILDLLRAAGRSGVTKCAYSLLNRCVRRNRNSLFHFFSAKSNTRCPLSTNPEATGQKVKLFKDLNSKNIFESIISITSNFSSVFLLIHKKWFHLIYPDSFSIIKFIIPFL